MTHLTPYNTAFTRHFLKIETKKSVYIHVNWQKGSLEARPTSGPLLLINVVEYRTQPAFTCSKLTLETLEQGVKYVQS